MWASERPVHQATIHRLGHHFSISHLLPFFSPLSLYAGESVIASFLDPVAPSAAPGPSPRPAARRPRLGRPGRPRGRHPTTSSRTGGTGRGAPRALARAGGAHPPPSTALPQAIDLPPFSSLHHPPSSRRPPTLPHTSNSPPFSMDLFDALPFSHCSELNLGIFFPRDFLGEMW